jgi:hypothetical protein
MQQLIQQVSCEDCCRVVQQQLSLQAMPLSQWQEGQLRKISTPSCLDDASMTQSDELIFFQVLLLSIMLQELGWLVQWLCLQSNKHNRSGCVKST